MCPAVAAKLFCFEMMWRYWKATIDYRIHYEIILYDLQVDSWFCSAYVVLVVSKHDILDFISASIHSVQSWRSANMRFVCGACDEFDAVDILHQGRYKLQKGDRKLLFLAALCQVATLDDAIIPQVGAYWRSRNLISTLPGSFSFGAQCPHSHAIGRSMLIMGRKEWCIGVSSRSSVFSSKWR